MPKILVTLPEDLVAQIDATCGARGRSAEIARRLRVTFTEPAWLAALVREPTKAHQGARPKAEGRFELQLGPTRSALGSRLKK